MDVIQRPLLSSLLEQLNSKQDPFVLMELRPQDPLPEWTTHIVFVEGQRLNLMTRDSYSRKNLVVLTETSKRHSDIPIAPQGRELARLSGVRVGYGKREVR